MPGCEWTAESWIADGRRTVLVLERRGPPATTEGVRRVLACAARRYPQLVRAPADGQHQPLPTGCAVSPALSLVEQPLIRPASLEALWLAPGAPSATSGSVKTAVYEEKLVTFLAGGREGCRQARERRRRSSLAASKRAASPVGAHPGQAKGLAPGTRRHTSRAVNAPLHRASTASRRLAAAPGGDPPAGVPACFRYRAEFGAAKDLRARACSLRRDKTAAGWRIADAARSVTRRGEGSASSRLDVHSVNRAVRRFR